VVPALTTALGSADASVRRSAVEALGRIGPAAAEAVPALTIALGDADVRVRQSAVEALRQIQSASPAANSA
jgi:HEAT repeat protein